MISTKKKLSSYALIILSQLFILTPLLAQDSITDPKTVDSVDLQKYTGTWFEISKIPNSFQNHCVNSTTATYKFDEDGNIIVINKCMDENGDIDEANGIARVVDTLSNSKLEVSFVSLFGIHLFWGDYWILGLEENYKYVVIGTPSRKYGWILCRTPQMEEIDLEKCYQILKQNGYNRNDFVLSSQENN